MKKNPIKLLNCDENLLKIIIEGDQPLATALDIHVPENWSTFGQAIFEYSLAKIKEEPKSKIWLTYLPIDANTNTLLSSYDNGKRSKRIILQMGSN